MNTGKSINIYDFKGIKANYHTHTTRCKHAKGEDREYVEAAIRAGYKILGFSDHTPYPSGSGRNSAIRMEMSEFEEYVDSVLRLKKEYEKDIMILLGLETEYCADYFDSLVKELYQYPMDYMILGQHFVADGEREHYVGNARTEESFLEAYINLVIEGVDTGYFSYVAHPDILNFTGDAKIYEYHMKRLAAAMKEKQMPLEVNLGGYRTKRNYPNMKFIELACDADCDFVMGVDAHEPGDLLDQVSSDVCIEMVQSRGGKVINKEWNF